ncbi:hypothetical protein M426DRAFT_259716 [Hypoxylon sp. CI-4A]|nr:hypothetical protein M426DRAFT_259716 [Hypoxylon sp. CI-4A]
MSTNNNESQGGSLLRLPTEIIQQIASLLDTSAQVANLASANQDLSSIVDASEIFKKEAECQLDIDRQIRAAYSHIPWNVRRGGWWTRIPTTTTPAILRVIENNKDISTVKQCIDAYRMKFPDALRGKWFAYYSSPMELAAEVGRLDVVQALFEANVPLRFWDEENWGDKTQYMVDALTPENLLESLMTLNIRDGFYQAYFLGRVDILQYMIENGAEARVDDVLSAAVLEEIESLDILLKSLDPERRALAAELTLKKVIDEAFGTNLDGCRVLLLAATHPSFDRLQWLKRVILTKLHGIYKRSQKVTEEQGVDSTLFIDQSVNTLIGLFDLFVELDEFKQSRSAVAIEIGYAAARLDHTIDINEALLEDFPSSVGENESDRQNFINEALSVAVDCGAVGTASYLSSKGRKPSSRDLRQAIMRDLPYMINFIVESGISASTSSEEFQDIAPLHLALLSSKFLAAVMLMQHGADYSNVSDEVKEALYFHCNLYHRSRIAEALEKGDMPVAPLDLTEYSIDSPTKESHEFMQLAYSIYKNVLGDGFLVELTKRFGEIRG